MYLCIRKKVEVNLNPSLEAHLNPNLEAQENLEPQENLEENQEVEKIEIEEANPSLETRIKKNKMKGTYGSPLTPPSGEPTVPSIAPL